MTHAEFKQAWKSPGLTQQGLADQLNRSKSAVEKWEAGPVDPVAAIAVKPVYGEIIRYRIKRPRALLDLIQLIADLPAPVAPIKTDGVIA